LDWLAGNAIVVIGCISVECGVFFYCQDYQYYQHCQHYQQSLSEVKRLRLGRF
jgi:hypothetical protein